jgi:hypothetical protein
MTTLKIVFLPVAFLLVYSPALLAQQPSAETPTPDRFVHTRPAVPGQHGLVVAGHPIAASAGLQILLKGGNAFDAAVAVGAMVALRAGNDRRRWKRFRHNL